MQKSLLNLIYTQMFVFSRLWMYLRNIGRRFTQMIAYFLVITDKPGQAYPPRTQFIIQKLNPLLVVDFRLISAFLYA